VNSVDTVGSPFAAAARPMVAHQIAPALERFGPISLFSPPGPLFGNAGKNILRQPGTENFDISLSKTLRVTERLSGILRFETYNTFNHTQFSTVDMGVKFDATGASANPLFMQPTAARPPRRIQLSMSMKW